jgi:hypothetical protein
LSLRLPSRPPRAWRPGERYDGEWREGLEDGIGVFTWQDSSTHEGFWLQVGLQRHHMVAFMSSFQGKANVSVHAKQ